ncbi:MAG TPA: transglycosylase SLT domain-containing protein [Bdellovibrionota bacterium]|nr:transglycosylase SLT domain-containing protein [Bdellovibrionota bacterium]
MWPLALLPAALASPHVSMELDGQRFFTTDLTEPQMDAVRAEIESDIRTERRKKDLPSDQKSALDMAEGLLHLNQGNLKKAIEYFHKAQKDSLLQDAALFYEARALRRLGTDAGQAGNPGDSINRCNEALAVLSRLAETDAGPFSDRAPEEHAQATLCYVRGLLKKNRTQEVRPQLFSILQSDMSLDDADRKLFWASMARILISEDEPVEARYWVDRGLQTFPEEPAFQELVKDLPPLPTLPARSMYRESWSQGRPRPQPEEKLFREAVDLQKKGHAPDAVEKLTLILRQYPNTIAAEKASVRLRSLVVEQLGYGSKSFAGIIHHLPAAPLHDLARAVWDEGFNREGAKIFEVFVKRFPDHPKCGGALYALGRIAEDRSRWSDARKWFEAIVRAHSTNSFFERAHFKVAWLSYLMKDFQKSIEYLQYGLSLRGRSMDPGEYLYWLAQAYDRSGRSKEARKYREELGKTAPLSYYAFLSDQLPTINQVLPSAPPPSDFWNSYRLRKARSYLSAGIPYGAAKVLDGVDLDIDPAASEWVALLYAVAREHSSAIRLTGDLIRRERRAGIPKHLAEIYFPVEFDETIRQYASSNELDPLLLFSLIKQESAYQENAESRTGALGLMQLMPQTAREVTKEGGESVPEKTELLVSHRNVELGARYLKKQLINYNGNLVYALAAYNAGPRKVDIWVRQWKKLPNEEFIELIPFPETRNYVKSIVRNYAFYAQLLEQRKVQPSDLQLVTRK